MVHDIVDREYFGMAGGSHGQSVKVGAAEPFPALAGGKIFNTFWPLGGCHGRSVWITAAGR